MDADLENFSDQEDYDSGGDGEEIQEPEKNEKKQKPSEQLLSNLRKLSGKKRLHREDVRKIRSQEKRQRRKKAKELGLPKQQPRTIENTRVPDEDHVEPDDQEVLVDESLDEMSSYFNKEVEPKVLITCSHNPHRETIRFCRELRNTIPNSEVRWRKKCPLKRLVKEAVARLYTDILVINEDWSKPNALLHIHLPNGPTAYYRLSGIKCSRQIKNRAHFNHSRPEIIINNMTTRLGHSIGRMLASLFHYDPQFRGRKVVTLHNQRDYIFFRQHLYEFKSGEKVAIRELGPRFTLKLRSLQKGTFDSRYGEYEWILRRHDQGVNRRKFFL